MRKIGWDEYDEIMHFCIHKHLCIWAGDHDWSHLHRSGGGPWSSRRSGLESERCRERSLMLYRYTRKKCMWTCRIELYWDMRWMCVKIKRRAWHENINRRTCDDNEVIEYYWFVLVRCILMYLLSRGICWVVDSPLLFCCFRWSLRASRLRGTSAHEIVSYFRHMIICHENYFYYWRTTF